MDYERCKTIRAINHKMAFQGKGLAYSQYRLRGAVGHKCVSTPLVLQVNVPRLW